MSETVISHILPSTVVASIRRTGSELVNLSWLEVEVLHYCYILNYQILPDFACESLIKFSSHPFAFAFIIIFLDIFKKNNF